VEKTNLMEILCRCAERRSHTLEVASVSGTVADVQQLLGSDPDVRQIWNNPIEVAKAPGN